MDRLEEDRVRIMADEEVKAIFATGLSMGFFAGCVVGCAFSLLVYLLIYNRPQG